MPLLLQLTRVQNNPAGLENILKRNGVEISQPQTQEEPVTRNEPPENILKQKSTPEERLIKRASQSVTPKTEREQKQKVGNAIIQLANQNGMAVPGVDFKALQNGSSQKIQEWQIHFDRRPKHRGVSCSG